MKRLIFNHIWLYIILILSISASLICLPHSPQVGVAHDDAAYLNLLKSFLTGHYYSRVSAPNFPSESVWPPGYPLFILTLLRIFAGTNYLIYQIASLILALANTILVYSLFRDKIDKPYVIIITALFALNYLIVTSASRVMTESTFIFFCMLFFNSFDRWQKCDQKINWFLIISLVTLTATFWVRYWGIALVVSVMIYLLIKKQFRWAFVFGAGFLGY